MLETLVIVPYFFSSLSSNPPILNSEGYILQNYQKPTIDYVQDSPESKNIPISKETQKDKDLKKVGDLHKKLVLEDATPRNVKNTLNFYNNVIKDNKDSSYLSEAYLNSGLIICCVQENKDVYEGANRLREAEHIAGNLDIKITALYYLGRLHLGYAQEKKGFTIDEAKEYFKKIIELVPSSDIAIESKKFIKEIEGYKQKTK